MSFLLVWLLCWIFWSFVIRGFTAHHASSPAAAGLAADTIA